MKKNTRKKYGLYKPEQKGQRTVSKSEAVVPGPFVIVAALLFVIFLFELVVLGNLWAINEIAGYFN